MASESPVALSRDQRRPYEQDDRGSSPAYATQCDLTRESQRRGDTAQRQADEERVTQLHRPGGYVRRRETPTGVTDR
jgi:hypothetical protein